MTVLIDYHHILFNIPNSDLIAEFKQRRDEALTEYQRYFVKQAIEETAKAVMEHRAGILAKKDLISGLIRQYQSVHGQDRAKITRELSSIAQNLDDLMNLIIEQASKALRALNYIPNDNGINSYVRSVLYTELLELTNNGYSYFDHRFWFRFNLDFQAKNPNLKGAAVQHYLDELLNEDDLINIFNKSENDDRAEYTLRDTPLRYDFVADWITENTGLKRLDHTYIINVD